MGTKEGVRQHRNLKEYGEENGDQHAHEARVVVETNIVADPKTVMVELISAPVASLAVFGVPQDMCVADFTIELKLVLVKDDHFVSFTVIRCLE